MNNAPNINADAQNHMVIHAERFLTFHLAGEEYGIDIMKIQEIIGLVPITTVPTAPEYCRGVINLRGKIIPTIDLRTKLGMESCDDTERTCIIIVEVQGLNGQTQFGLVVDEVAEVLHVSEAEMNPAQEYGASLDTAVIEGIGVVEDKVKIFLDIDRVLSVADHALAEA